MNPYSRFKQWVAGKALAPADNAFDQVRIDVLVSFTLFFLVLNIPYVISTLRLSAIHIFVSVFSLCCLCLVFVILRATGSVRKATLFYVSIHCTLNITHFILNEGQVEMQGILFFLLIALYSYMMLDRRWGLLFTVFVSCMIGTGLYILSTGHALFTVPESWHEPKPSGPFAFFAFVPLFLNIYLVAQFVKARRRAEQQISEQKIQLEASNRILALKNEDIVSSISYAKKIQYAVLPNEETIYRSIPLSFILYRPKDIVSGDFFWFHEIDHDNYIIAAADCTGHGVPGAFMTVIGSNALTQTIVESRITEPAQILSDIDDHITATLKQERTHYGLIQDGMDIALLSIDKQKKEFVFSGARRPAFFLRDGELKELKGNRSSIGGLRSEKKSFSATAVSFREDDMIFLFSDGIVDQFGGPANKKFSTRRLRELLISIHLLPVSEQKQKITEAFESWKGNNEQTDDVMLIGIRF